jgi:hypothetical protein
VLQRPFVRGRGAELLLVGLVAHLAARSFCPLWAHAYGFQPDSTNTGAHQDVWLGRKPPASPPHRRCSRPTACGARSVSTGDQYWKRTARGMCAVSHGISASECMPPQSRPRFELCAVARV